MGNNTESKYSTKFNGVYFTKLQYEYLKHIFPSKEILPVDTLPEIQYRAGSTKVVDFIGSKVRD